MAITSLSLKGSSPWNEDARICNEAARIYGVIDGVTSIVPFAGADGKTGGVMASDLIANHLNNVELSSENPQDLLQLLVEANELLRLEMERNNIDLERKEELWSACAVVVCIHDHWVDYAHAGDCMLIAYYQDGTIRVVTHDQLGVLEQLALDQWAEMAADGLTQKEDLLAYTKSQIIRGRQLANSPGGYAVLNGDPSFTNNAEYGRISLAGIQALLLVSDGLYIPKAADAPKVDGAAELALFVREMGMQQFVNWLIDLEESDAECIQYPRVKKSDDKTAIYIELSKK